MFIKFSEHAIIQALNFNEQYRFCTFSTQILILGLILLALIKKKNNMYIWITKAYYYEIRGEKNTWER